MEVRYLGLGEALLIAERILDVPADTLARNSRTIALLESALAAPKAGFGGQDAHPTLEGKIAALGWHIIRDHPLPDGNKRLGFFAMLEMAERNGHALHVDGPEADDRHFRAIAAGEVSVEKLTFWVHDRLRQ